MGSLWGLQNANSKKTQGTRQTECEIRRGALRMGGERERERMGSLNKTLWERTRATKWRDKTNAHDPSLLAFQVITKDIF